MHATRVRRPIDCVRISGALSAQAASGGGKSLRVARLRVAFSPGQAVALHGALRGGLHPSAWPQGLIPGQAPPASRPGPSAGAQAQSVPRGRPCFLLRRALCSATRGVCCLVASSPCRCLMPFSSCLWPPCAALWVCDAAASPRGLAAWSRTRPSRLSPFAASAAAAHLALAALERPAAGLEEEDHGVVREGGTRRGAARRASAHFLAPREQHLTLQDAASALPCAEGRLLAPRRPARPDHAHGRRLCWYGSLAEDGARGMRRASAAGAAAKVHPHPRAQAAENAERRELFPARKKGFGLGF